MTLPVWSGAALADLDRIFDSLNERDPAAARRIVDEIVVYTDRRLKDFPLVGPALGSGVRRKLSLPATGYVAIYRVDGRQARILRVHHAAEAWPV